MTIIQGLSLPLPDLQMHNTREEYINTITTIANHTIGTTNIKVSTAFPTAAPTLLRKVLDEVKKTSERATAERNRHEEALLAIAAPLLKPMAYGVTIFFFFLVLCLFCGIGPAAAFAAGAGAFAAYTSAASSTS